jgi:putative ABC transport system substrate-binding protein
VKRREFITLLGGAAAWPFTVRAQQPERMRRIGVLLDFAEEDAEGQARLAALLHGLRELGWIVDRNVLIDPRWAATDVDRVRRSAAELVGLTPDVIVEVAPRLCGHCNRRRTLSRSCSRGSPTRSAAA